MRSGPEFVAMSHRAGAPMVAPAHGMINGTAPHSPWQSPVPYLFGGLAAMLGLIAFALLILACSYWKLSGYLDGDRESQAAGGDGEKGSASGASKPALDFQEHVVVIMAGDERPTFLAKPATSRAAEAELAAAAAAASVSAVAGQEKKVDEQSCEVSSQLGGDHADAARRSHGHQDAASQSSDHHHHDHESSSSTTALQKVAMKPEEDEMITKSDISSNSIKFHGCNSLDEKHQRLPHEVHERGSEHARDRWSPCAACSPCHHR